MNKRPSFKDFKEEVLKDKKIRKEYEALRPEFELMMQFIKARKEAKISQENLAKKLNLQQSSIARLENGAYTTTSCYLSKIANALGYSITIYLHKR